MLDSAQYVVILIGVWTILGDNDIDVVKVPIKELFGSNQPSLLLTNSGDDNNGISLVTRSVSVTGCYPIVQPEANVGTRNVTVSPVRWIPKLFTTANATATTKLAISTTIAPLIPLVKLIIKRSGDMDLINEKEKDRGRNRGFADRKTWRVLEVLLLRIQKV
ncbi:hypothetical protein AT2G05105 [Arabidopsis thaliana]|uniref:Uncharacterized protein n=1 Tax=Arabidopsis thaliana TaxID=3702 RepID=A0A1P8AZD7_ARATH|nr:uncharacterized protein AT2G05105 [Arabidopsis thaliana]ANM61983.1 hypothetical protein AT2G05105 [Arabidopsis thaliana]|eukprot:NP_001324167.1 hypothetical protein AT2G05105 [Arabidopsis thaliana]